MFEFVNRFGKTILLLTIVNILVFSGCSDLDISEVKTVYGDVFVFDTLQAHIRYDATPGFKYPLMNYESNFVVQLTQKGVVDAYEFTCEPGNIRAGVSFDYISRQEPGYKFRYKINIWSKLLLNINSVVPYSQYFSAFVDAGKKEYTYTSVGKVEYYTDGIQPEQNSLQLTGPENRNYNPQFSPDGRWIYFQSSDDQRTIFRTDQNGNGYEKIADFNSSTFSQGKFSIIDNNHLAYIENGNQISKFVIKDLQTFSESIYQLNSTVWGKEPIKIPNTNKFLNLSYPNEFNGYKSQLLAVDLITQKVDTLLKYFQGSVIEYTLNPRNNNIFVLTESSNSYDILEYDYVTDQFSIFLSNVNYLKNFRFFPNGYDYAYIRKDQSKHYNIFLNIAGIEKQLTQYPGDINDFSISPNGDFIAFSANRRGEIQSWIIRLN